MTGIIDMTTVVIGTIAGGLEMDFMAIIHTILIFTDILIITGIMATTIIRHITSLITEM